MRKVISVATIISVGVLAATGLLLPAAVEEGPSYHITGDYFETCSCNPACPCVFKSDATHGYCKASVVFHVADGSVGEIEVAGLNVAIALVSAGNMSEHLGKMRGVLYVDEKGTPEQRQALSGVFGRLFAPFMAEMKGPKPAAIAYAREGDTFSVMIPEVLDAAIEPLKGPRGGQTALHHVPFGGLVEPVMAGKSLRHTYSDADLDSWEYDAGRNGFFGAFEYASKKE